VWVGIETTTRLDQLVLRVAAVVEKDGKETLFKQTREYFDIEPNKLHKKQYGLSPQSLKTYGDYKKYRAEVVVRGVMVAHMTVGGEDGEWWNTMAFDQNKQQLMFWLDVRSCNNWESSTLNEGKAKLLSSTRWTYPTTPTSKEATKTGDGSVAMRYSTHKIDKFDREYYVWQSSKADPKNPKAIIGFDFNPKVYGDAWFNFLDAEGYHVITIEHKGKYWEQEDRIDPFFKAFKEELKAKYNIVPARTALVGYAGGGTWAIRISLDEQGEWMGAIGVGKMNFWTFRGILAKAKGERYLMIISTSEDDAQVSIDETKRLLDKYGAESEVLTVPVLTADHPKSLNPKIAEWLKKLTPRK
jgi:predicted esterase